ANGAGGAGTSGQGNNGGAGITSGSYGGGGGGGGAVDKAAEAVKKLRQELEGQFPKALDAAAAIARKATEEFDAYAKSIEDAILRTLNYSDAYDAG
ncbi:hypothetical protein, partial [Escherichia coli]|uniref:hypothetical protein n=1 Tax=Escherichia coli TaxID=562 RepID=UPI0020102339